MMLSIRKEILKYLAPTLRLLWFSRSNCQKYSNIGVAMENEGIFIFEISAR
jgi:hypothetical protein